MCPVYSAAHGEGRRHGAAGQGGNEVPERCARDRVGWRGLYCGDGNEWEDDDRQHSGVGADGEAAECARQ